MRKLIFIILFISFSTALIIGCGDEPKTEKITFKIVRLLMHTENEYSVWIKKGNKRIRKSVNCKTPDNVSYIVVERGDDMRVELWPVPGNEDYSYAKHSYCSKIIFYISSVDDINGAGWNHGKNGSGQTTVIR